MKEKIKTTDSLIKLFASEVEMNYEEILNSQRWKVHPVGRITNLPQTIHLDQVRLLRLGDALEGTNGFTHLNLQFLLSINCKKSKEKFLRFLSKEINRIEGIDVQEDKIDPLILKGLKIISMNTELVKTSIRGTKVYYPCINVIVTGLNIDLMDGRVCNDFRGICWEKTFCAVIPSQVVEKK